LIIKNDLMSFITIIYLVLLSGNFTAASLPDHAEVNSKKFMISGKVQELASGESLAGVEIQILGSGKIVYTDFNGDFEIRGLDINDEYTLQISYVSYKKKIIRGIKAGSSALIIEMRNESMPVRGPNPSINPST